MDQVSQEAVSDTLQHVACCVRDNVKEEPIGAMSIVGWTRLSRNLATTKNGTTGTTRPTCSIPCPTYFTFSSQGRVVVDLEGTCREDMDLVAKVELF